MGSPSKEEALLELFFNKGHRHWSFNDLLNETNISRSKLAKWLNKFRKEKIIKRVKPKNKMPFYTYFFESPSFAAKKRLFALESLQKSGLLSHLISLEDAKTIILFGSFARSDWYYKSDIDIFIFGKETGFKQRYFERKLSREIQIVCANSIEELKKINPLLLYNLIRGYVIKGEIDFIKVTPHDGSREFLQKMQRTLPN